MTTEQRCGGTPGAPAPVPSEGREALLWRYKYALMGLAEQWGEGGAEGFIAAVAVSTLGWCEVCGMPNDTVPAHSVMAAMGPYGHEFKAARIEDHWPSQWLTDYREPGNPCPAPVPVAPSQSGEEQLRKPSREQYEAEVAHRDALNRLIAWHRADASLERLKRGARVPGDETTTPLPPEIEAWVQEWGNSRDDTLDALLHGIVERMEKRAVPVAPSQSVEGARARVLNPRREDKYLSFAERVDALIEAVRGEVTSVGGAHYNIIAKANQELSQAFAAERTRAEAAEQREAELRAALERIVEEWRRPGYQPHKMFEMARAALGDGAGGDSLERPPSAP